MRATNTIIAFLLVFTLFALPSFASLNVTDFSPSENSSLILNSSSTQVFTVTLNDTTNIVYNWFVDGTSRQNNSNNVFSYTPTSLGVTTIFMNATQTSTNKTVEHYWNATVVDPESGKGLTGPTFALLGGDNQRASNDEADDEELRDVYVERSFKLKNNNAVDIQNLTAQVTPQNGFSQPADINMSVSFSPDNISAGQELSFTIRARVPDRIDAVNETDLDIKETSFQVALMKITGTLVNGSTSITEFPVNIQRKNNLLIKDLDVCVETDCQDVGTDSTVDNVKPGDTVEIRIEVENFFSTNEGEDLDIDDVELTFEIDDDEFNEDDDEDLGSISARGEDDHIFELKIDDEIKSGQYQVVVRATGRDENGGKHGSQQQFTLDIERKSHDVKIQSVDLNPSTFTCARQDRVVKVTLITQNVGRNDEDEAFITVRNSRLGLNQEIGPFLISEDNKRTDTLTFTLPEDVRKDTYDIIVKSYFDTDKQTDEEGATLTVAECSEGDDESTDSSNDTTSSDDSTASSSTQSSTQNTATRRTTSTPTATSQRTFSTPSSGSQSTKSATSNVSPLMIFLLVFVIASILGIIVLLIIRLR